MSVAPQDVTVRLVMTDGSTRRVSVPEGLLLINLHGRIYQYVGVDVWQTPTYREVPRLSDYESSA